MNPLYKHKIKVNWRKKWNVNAEKIRATSIVYNTHNF